MVVTVSCCFNDTATTEIYTLSLHDALPISHQGEAAHRHLAGDHHDGAPGGPPDDVDDDVRPRRHPGPLGGAPAQDRKSTRLNSSHANISHAVFCLKKTHRPVLL